MTIYRKTRIIVSDVGSNIDHLNLYNLLLFFEKVGFSQSLTRSLRNLAFTNLSTFLSTLTSRRLFKNFLLKQEEAQFKKSKCVFFRYFVLRKKILQYRSAIRFLEKFGTVSIDSSALGEEFSPYYSLGRDLPLHIRIPLNNKKLNADHLDIKLFDSGMISGSIALNIRKKGENKKNLKNNNDVQESLARKFDDLMISIIKDNLLIIKKSVIKKCLSKKPDFAFHYYDRYEVVVRSYKKAYLDEIKKNKDYKLIRFDDHYYLVSKENAFLFCSVFTERIERSIYLFEISLLQKFFLTTRDSYVDKYIRNYDISGRLYLIERYLSNFHKIVKLFLFAKEEGGHHKIFMDTQFNSLYLTIHKSFGISNLIIHVDSKIKDALNLFSSVSSMKRDKSMLYLTYLIAFLTLVLAIDLLLKIFN